LRIHASQLNLNAEVFAADAVARAEAKASAELTRKKLLSFASALAGELNDPADCVVKLRGNGEEPEGQGRHDQGTEEEEAEPAAAEENPFSGWA
jgi:hypothetical protein